MRGKCLDESVLQSYLDGELSPELTGEAAHHLAACGACSEALAAAEAECALFGAAFAPDAALPVPTESLRDRLDAALAGARTQTHAPRGWNFSALAAWLAAPFNFAPRQAAAFASLVAVVAFASILGLVYLRRDDPTHLADKSPAGPGAPKATASAPQQPEVGQPAVQREGNAVATPAAGGVNTNQNVPAAGTGAVKIVRASRGPAAGRASKAATVASGPEPDPAQLAVPGEDKYLQAIASLSRAVELAGDAALKPSLRAELERNIAVIDRAISETRKQALRNPGDADATGFLFSAYQNKIDLLSTVADQAQVAALGR